VGVQGWRPTSTCLWRGLRRPEAREVEPTEAVASDSASRREVTATRRQPGLGHRREARTIRPPRRSTEPAERRRHSRRCRRGRRATSDRAGECAPAAMSASTPRLPGEPAAAGISRGHSYADIHTKSTGDVSHRLDDLVRVRHFVLARREGRDQRHGELRKLDQPALAEAPRPRRLGGDQVDAHEPDRTADRYPARSRSAYPVPVTLLK
jgi:hypothetical protein